MISLPWHKSKDYKINSSTIQIVSLTLISVLRQYIVTIYDTTTVRYKTIHADLYYIFSTR